MKDSRNDEFERLHTDDSRLSKTGFIDEFVGEKQELDQELAKSIEKLVEEETNGARAYIESKSGDERSIPKREVTYERDNTLSMKTQVLPQIGQSYDREDSDHTNTNTKTQAIPQQEIAIHTAQHNLKSDKIGEPEQKASVPQSRGKTKRSKKKKKKIIIGVSILVILLCVVIITAVITISNHAKSFEYNYQKGIEYMDEGNQDQAIKYLEIAYNTTNGKNNTNVMYLLYECYTAKGNTNMAVTMLKNILSHDKYNEKAITQLAQYYSDDADGASLNDLIATYKDTEGEKYLESYEVSEPEASKDEGNYQEALSISLTADDDDAIYYTLDGSDPVESGKLYVGAITIEEGTTVLKAVCIDAIGVTSDVAEFKYVITYGQPDAPEIDPESGTYTAGQTISIDNLSDGDTAYYTLDGSTPTVNSTEYTEPFDMPEGNTVVSAIIISKYNVTSAVTRRNYVVSVTKSYTYDEAEQILKNRMISLNLLKSDGSTTTDGSEVSFVNQSTKTVQNHEIWYIRMDVKKNGTTTTQGYYGVGVKDGQCYKVTETNGSFSIVNY